MLQKEPVSIVRQMIFAVIPGLDLYASYKIQKLRLWVLIFWVCGSIIGILHGYALFGEDYFIMFVEEDYFDDPAHLADYVLVLVIFAILQASLMRKWSKKWNSQLKSSS